MYKLQWRHTPASKDGQRLVLEWVGDTDDPRRDQIPRFLDQLYRCQLISKDSFTSLSNMSLRGKRRGLELRLVPHEIDKGTDKSRMTCVKLWKGMQGTPPT